MDAGDVRVVERGEHLRLALEPAEPIGVVGDGLRQQLDRDAPAQLAVLGEVDLAHATLAELGRDLEMRQTCTDHDDLRESCG